MFIHMFLDKKERKKTNHIWIIAMSEKKKKKEEEGNLYVWATVWCIEISKSQPNNDFLGNYI